MNNSVTWDELKAIERRLREDKPSAASAGYLSVPAEPEPECIDSMCLRYDHSFGLKKFSYRANTEETDEEFEFRRNAIRLQMRQLYEEATGQGFFKR